MASRTTLKFRDENRDANRASQPIFGRRHLLLADAGIRSVEHRAVVHDPDALDAVPLVATIALIVVRLVESGDRGGAKNFANWAETARITAISQGGGTLCIEHTMLGRWPRTTFFDDPNTLIEGNQWYFALINGTSFGGAGEWVRPGQSCKAFDGGPEEFYDVNQEPLHSWNPRPGDLVGVASSTPARAWPQIRTSDERTNVEMVPWQ